MITKIIIYEMKTAIVRDDKHTYYEAGGDINIRNELTDKLEPGPITAVATDKITDKCMDNDNY